MEIIQIVGIGLIAAILAVIFKNDKENGNARPEYAMQISIVAAILIIALLLGKISSIMNLMEQLISRVNIEPIYFTTVLKIIGIAYITEFGAHICKDVGESAIASKIELGGKVLIMVLAIPILVALLDLMIEIMP